MRKLCWHPHRISTSVGTLIRTIGWFSVEEELWNMNSWSASFCRFNPCESWSSKQIYWAASLKFKTSDLTTVSSQAFVVRSLGHLLTGIKVDTKSTPQWESASVLAMLHVYAKRILKRSLSGTSRLDILPINVVHPSGFNYLSVVVPEGSRVLYNYSSYNSISIPYEVDEV